MNRPRKQGPGRPRELVCPPAVQKAMPDADGLEFGQRSVSGSVEPTVYDIHVVVDPVLDHDPRVNLVAAGSRDPLVDHRRIEFHLAVRFCDWGLRVSSDLELATQMLASLPTHEQFGAYIQPLLSRLTFSRPSARAGSSIGEMCRRQAPVSGNRTGSAVRAGTRPSTVPSTLHPAGFPALTVPTGRGFELDLPHAG